jgi:hypothetical protein
MKNLINPTIILSLRRNTSYLFNPLTTIGVILLLLLINSCAEDDAVEIKLGANYQGGIIFYLDSTGEHGLIASSNDQSRSTSWWNGSFTVTNATSATNGSSNTTAIINVQGNSGSYAAKLCRDYRGGGKSDWFLPSKDQLNLMYSQKALVGGFADEIYWSSTEYEIGSAWVQYFLDGLQHLDNTSDGATVGTRAIRAF